MYKLFASLLVVMAVFLDLNAQKVTAQLDLGKRTPHPEFIEHSPVDQGLVTLGAEFSPVHPVTPGNAW